MSLVQVCVPPLVAGDSSKREDTNMVGTPQYMSPELLSQQHYSFQTDVW
jgi:serine/threonine protein kinase